MDAHIKKLEQCELESGLAQEIKKCLESVCNASDLKKTLKSILDACDFYIKQMQIAESLVAHNELIDIVHICSSSLTEMGDDYETKYRLAQRIWSLCTQLLKKENFELAYKLAGCLLGEGDMVLWHDVNKGKKLNSHFSYLYARFWNAALGVKEAKEAFQMQSTSLKLLYLQDFSINTVDKMTSAAKSCMQKDPASLLEISTMFSFFWHDALLKMLSMEHLCLEDFLPLFKMLSDWTELYHIKATNVVSYRSFRSNWHELRKVIMTRAETDLDTEFGVFCCNIGAIESTESEPLSVDWEKKWNEMCSYFDTLEGLNEHQASAMGFAINCFLWNVYDTCLGKSDEAITLPLARAVAILEPVLSVYLLHMMKHCDAEDPVCRSRGFEAVAAILACLLSIFEEYGHGDAGDITRYSNLLEEQLLALQESFCSETFGSINCTKARMSRRAFAAYKSNRKKAALHLGKVAYAYGKAALALCESQTSRESLKAELVNLHKLVMRCSFEEKRLDEATNSVVDCLATVPRKASEVVDNWVMLKNYFTADDEAFFTRSLAGCFRDCGVMLQEDRMVEILRLEYQSYLRNRGTLASAAFTVLEDLVQVNSRGQGDRGNVDSLLVNCYAKSQIAYLVWKYDLKFQNLSPLESCESFVDEMESTMSLEGFKDCEEMPLLKLYLSVFKFWLFVVMKKVVENQIKAESEASDSVQSSPKDRDANVNEENEDATSFWSGRWSRNLGTELACLEPLMDACGIWCELFLESQDIDLLPLCKDVSLLSIIKAAVHAFSLSKMDAEKVKCLSIMEKVASSLGSASEQVYALCLEARMLLETNHWDKAKALISKAKKILEETGTEDPSLLVLLSECWQHYYSSQFQNSLYSLEKVHIHLGCQKNQPNVHYHLLAQACLAACRLSLIPLQSFVSVHFANQCALKHAVEATENAAFLLKWCSQYHKITAFSLDHLWEVYAFTELYMEACSLWAQLLIDIGSILEVRNALKTQYTIAQQFVVSSWTAEILIQMSTVHYQCNMIEQSVHEADKALSVLNFSTKCLLSTTNPSSPPESPEVFPSEDADFVLQAPKASLWSLAIHKLNRQPESPSKWNANITIPDFFSHPFSCSCLPCSTPFLIELHLKLLLLSGCCNPSKSKAQHIFDSILGMSDRVRKKYRASKTKALQPVIGKVTSSANLLSIHDPVIRTLCRIELEKALLLLADRKYSQALECISKAMVRFETNRNMQLVSCNLYATLLYTRALALTCKTFSKGQWGSNSNAMLKKREARGVENHDPMGMERDVETKTPELPLAKNGRRTLKLQCAPTKKIAVSTPMKNYLESLRESSSRARNVDEDDDEFETLVNSITSVSLSNQSSVREVGASKTRATRSSTRKKAVLKSSENTMDFLAAERQRTGSVDLEPLPDLTEPELGKVCAKINFGVAVDNLQELENAKTDLEEALRLVSHNPPFPLYSKLNLLLAILHFQDEKQSLCIDKTTVAFLLSESHAVTSRHLVAMGLMKLATSVDGKASSVPTPPSQEVIETKTDMLMFKSPLSSSRKQKLDDLLGNIPEGWRVVQVTALPFLPSEKVHEDVVPDVCITRYEKACAPLMAMVRNSDADPQFGRTCLSQFRRIIAENDLSLTKEDPKSFWVLRTSLDKQLREVVRSMEDYWLGFWKGLFLGCPQEPRYRTALAKMVTKLKRMSKELNVPLPDQNLMQMVLESASYLTKEQLSDAVSHIWAISPSHSAHAILVQGLDKFAEKLDQKQQPLQPLILVLDKSFQELPWENMPILRDRGVSRVPSLRFLVAQLKGYRAARTPSVFETGADPLQTYYILDPQDNLPATKKKFHTLFLNEQSWTGVIGNPPSKEDMLQALTQKDILIYCGHGAGKQYVSGLKLCQVDCRPVLLLMGCSSGRLSAPARHLEPTGIALRYWTYGSPCIVANLWNVTDKDIDTFLDRLLGHWLPNWCNKDVAGAESAVVTEAVCKARPMCKLPYLIGAAPVVYGIPVFCTQ